MGTNVTARVLSFNLIPSEDPSSYLGFIFTVLILAFIAGILIIFLTQKHNNAAERPPVFGAELEAETELTQNVDLSVPGAEDLTLSQEDIAVHPVPQLGHPDDEGVPVPKYDEEAKTLVVDTDVAPVDVNADVPVMPIPDTPNENDRKESTDMDTNETENQETQNETPETEAVTPEPANAESVEAEPVAPESVGAPSAPEAAATPLERIKRVALEAKDKAGEKAGDLKDKAQEIATSEKAQELRSTLETKAGEAKEKATELWEKTKQSAQDEDSLIGKTKTKALGLKDKAKGLFQKNDSQENPAADSE